MKKITFLSLMLLGACSANAQKMKESEVPAAVKETFNKSFQNAKGIKWEKEGVNFEAEFEIGESEKSAVIDATGKLLEVETEIEVSQLPVAIKDYIAKNYGNAKISEAAEMKDASEKVTYQAEISGKDLIFDSTGAFVKEIAKGKHEKED